jgi:hypothetical protein
MKKNMVPATNSFFVLMGLVYYFLIAFSLVGCNSPEKDKPKEPVRNWITLDVQFKVNTAADLRDLAMRTIEKILIDSFIAHKDPTNQIYTPIISISKSPTTDTLQYFLNVGPDSNSSRIQSFPPHPQEPTDRPTCKCADCKICSIIQGYLENPPPDHPEYKYILSVTYTTPEIDSK